MGDKVILATISFLYLTNGEEIKAMKSFVSDSTSAESAPILYRATPPFGIYASSSPYEEYSIHAPVSSEPQKEASHFVPVVQKHAAFIRDSYGNRFVAIPKTMAYRTTLPQQYVKLQGLPKHLSQPLVTASETQYSNVPHHVSYGSGVPHKQPKQLRQLVQAHPKSYASNVNTVSTKARQIMNRSLSGQQQPSNHKAVYSNSHPHEKHVHSSKQSSFFNPKDSYFNSDREKFQKLKKKVHKVYAQERNAENIKQKNDGKKPSFKNIEKSNNKNTDTSDSKQVTVTTVDHEGIKTILTLDTQPPIPQLNLDWLKPLEFDEPIVPQVQHFLPKIEYNLDEAVKEENNNQNNYLVYKSKPFDNESHHPRPDDVEEEEVDEEEHEPAPKPTSRSKTPPQHRNTESKNTIVLEREDEPDKSYEINTPTHKESFNQKSIKYDMKTTKDPVLYSYNTKTDKNPVTYSYSSSSKAPPKHEELEYEIVQRKGEPVQILYNSNPRKNHNSNDEEDDHLQNASKSKQAEHSEENESMEDTSEESHDEPPRKYSENFEHEYYEEEPTKPSHSLKPEHREGEDNSYRKSKNPSHVPEEIIYGKPKHSEESKVPVYNFKPQYQAITPEYEEKDVHLLRPHKPHGPISEYDKKKHKSAPLLFNDDEDDKSNEHDAFPNKQKLKSHKPEYDSDEESKHNLNKFDSTNQKYKEKPHSTPIQKNDGLDTEIHEKSREVILQDESPEELHSLRELMRAEMIKEEENNEEDFDKQYKAAAYGFPAYNNQDEDEKEVFSPDSYGEPNFNSNFDARDAPFERYTQGDNYPKSARLEYKDIADDTKEDYVLDYSISKPKIVIKGLESKADYYKNYKKHKPEIFFKDETKERRSEQLNLAPEFNFETNRPPKHTFGPFKPIPKFNYNSKRAPSDSFAFASGAHIRKKTLFVEPQFQYGFEQSSLPQLFDSELSSSPSNIQTKTLYPQKL